MIEKLKIKAIYNDFLANITLTDEQVRILDLLIQRETIVKIAMSIGVSERTINYEISKLKKLYSDYYELQIAKTNILTK